MGHSNAPLNTLPITPLTILDQLQQRHQITVYIGITTDQLIRRRKEA